MTSDQIIDAGCKKLEEGQSYSVLKNDLLETHEINQAIFLATSTYKKYKKKRIKTLAKTILVFSILIVFVQLTAPSWHTFKPKITYLLWFFMILKVIYEWFNLVKSDRDFEKTT
jgi:hypothetical protein